VTKAMVKGWGKLFFVVTLNLDALVLLQEGEFFCRHMVEFSQNAIRTHVNKR